MSERAREVVQLSREMSLIYERVWKPQAPPGAARAVLAQSRAHSKSRLEEVSSEAERSVSALLRQPRKREAVIPDGNGVAHEDIHGRLHSGLKFKSRDVIYNLLGFLASRDAAEATSEAKLPNDVMDDFPSFKHSQYMRQHRLDGEGPVRDYDELEEVARAAMPGFTTLMRRVVTTTGLDPDAYALHQGARLPIEGRNFFRVLTIAPLKSRKRCDEKVTNEYGGEYDCVLDCVRCSIVVESEQQLQTAMSFLSEGDVSLLAQAPPADAAGTFVVVRLKNRYSEPLFNGYRDALINIALAVGKCWVVCEVQLHIAAMLALKADMHIYYEFFRSFFSGNTDAVERRMEALDVVGRAASPDQLLKDALTGNDKKRLAGLAKLFDESMMGDFTLLMQVERRRLELVIRDASTEAERKEAVDQKARLAGVLWSAGLFVECEPLLAEVLEDQRRTLGNDHVQTLVSMNNYANLLDDTGRREDAEALYREALEAQRRTLGDLHPDTLTSMSNVAILDKETGRLEEAEALYRDCLTGRRQVLGNHDPSTLASMGNLALLLEDTDRRKEAEALHREALAGQRRSLGEDHPDTLRSMDLLADSCAWKARAAVERHAWAEASAAYEEAIRLRSVEFGDDDFEIASWKAEAAAVKAHH